MRLPLRWHTAEFLELESDEYQYSSTIISGEFDPGSERTLAGGLTHASRARTSLRWLVQRRTGE